MSMFPPNNDSDRKTQVPLIEVAGPVWVQGSVCANMLIANTVSRAASKILFENGFSNIDLLLQIGLIKD